MTTAPGPDTTAVDAALVDRARTSAEYLQGLITQGMLETAGTPAHLPELLFEHLDPDAVRQVWDTALAVGYRAGKAAHRPDWDTATLDRLRQALLDAGYRGMARTVERTAYAAPSRPAPLRLVTGQEEGR